MQAGLCMVMNDLQAMILRQGTPVQGLFSAWHTAPVLRNCYGHQARLLHHRRHLRRPVCVFLPRAASALHLLLGGSIAMASDSSRPKPDGQYFRFQGRQLPLEQYSRQIRSVLRIGKRYCRRRTATRRFRPANRAVHPRRYTGVVKPRLLRRLITHMQCSLPPIFSINGRTAAARSCGWLTMAP